MRILKFAIAGAIIAAGVTYITQKREDGTSILDDLTENAPDWVTKAKDLAAQAVDKVTETIMGVGRDEPTVVVVEEGPIV